MGLCAVDSVGQRLGEMRPADGRGAVEIGDRAGELQHAMEAACRKIEPFRSLAQQSHAGDIRPRGLFDDRTRRRRIGEDMWQAERSITLDLNVPRRRDARRDFGRSLSRRRQEQVRSIDCRYLDHEIDAVEQRPREPRLILPDTTRDGLAAATETRIERMAAAAGVHRRDKLKPRRIDDPMIGAGDGDLAGFERLAQRVENLRLDRPSGKDEAV